MSANTEETTSGYTQLEAWDILCKYLKNIYSVNENSIEVFAYTNKYPLGQNIELIEAKHQSDEILLFVEKGFTLETELSCQIFFYQEDEVIKHSYFNLKDMCLSLKIEFPKYSNKHVKLSDEEKEIQKINLKNFYKDGIKSTQIERSKPIYTSKQISTFFKKVYELAKIYQNPIYHRGKMISAKDNCIFQKLTECFNNILFFPPQKPYLELLKTLEDHEKLSFLSPKFHEELLEGVIPLYDLNLKISSCAFFLTDTSESRRNFTIINKNCLDENNLIYIKNTNDKNTDEISSFLITTSLDDGLTLYSFAKNKKTNLIICLNPNAMPRLVSKLAEQNNVHISIFSENPYHQILFDKTNSCDTPLYLCELKAVLEKTKNVENISKQSIAIFMPLDFNTNGFTFGSWYEAYQSLSTLDFDQYMQNTIEAYKTRYTRILETNYLDELHTEQAIKILAKKGKQILSLDYKS